MLRQERLGRGWGWMWRGTKHAALQPGLTAIARSILQTVFFGSATEHKLSCTSSGIVKL